MLKCSVCKSKLTNLNWSKCLQKYKIYTCKNCDRKQVLNWEHNNQNLVNSMARKYDQKYTKFHCIDTTKNGIPKRLYGIKRKFPINNRCELCNGLFIKLISYAYHHWNDKYLNFGIWICRRCHLKAEGIETYLKDKEFKNKYLKLKGDVENGG